ncbi:unnamed protein product [Effrenium voratum]|nr:unnamed protein product [Effrenium voratum]
MQFETCLTPQEHKQFAHSGCMQNVLSGTGPPTFVLLVGSVLRMPLVPGRRKLYRPIPVQFRQCFGGRACLSVATSRNRSAHRCLAMALCGVSESVSEVGEALI